MTLALLAAYQLLGSLDLVRAAFTEPLAEMVRDATTAMLDYAEDPYQAMVDLAKAREEHFFGAGFTFEHAVDDGTRFHQDVHRCLYHEVLAGNGSPELAPVMCAFDGNWIEAIDPDRHGFRFDRATTIGTGGPVCPFHFNRVTASATPAG